MQIFIYQGIKEKCLSKAIKYRNKLFQLLNFTKATIFIYLPETLKLLYVTATINVSYFSSFWNIIPNENQIDIQHKTNIIEYFREYSVIFQFPILYFLLWR